MTHPTTIILDAAPLGLILHRRQHPSVRRCRQWLTGHLAAGVRIVVAEVIDYEVRRELLRLSSTRSLEELDRFNAAEPDRYLSLSTEAMRLAARLWAEARRDGRPTADPHALDADVILAAQTLVQDYPPDSFVVATSNVGHLSRFVPTDHWENIQPLPSG